MLRSIEIKSVDDLVDGASFGGTGAYERVVVVGKGEVDPDAAANKDIALIDKAPRNASAKVEYTTDVYILRPKDPAKGNGILLFEVHNRGRKLMLRNFNAELKGNQTDYNNLTDAGDGFLMQAGYTLVWYGWQADIMGGEVNERTSKESIRRAYLAATAYSGDEGFHGAQLAGEKYLRNAGVTK